MLALGLGLAPQRRKGRLAPASSEVFAINGDSRTQQAVGGARTFQSSALTDPLTNAADTRANGWVSHCLAQLGHRIILPRGCQFAIGAENTADMALRAVQDATQAAVFGATTVIFLGGVNDGTTLTLEQSIANYTTIFDAFTAQGIRLVVCNELPRDGLSAPALAAHLARRDWLADPARAVTWPGMVQVDTFSPCLKPATAADWRDGYSYDGLHPAYAGSKVIGQTIAAAIAAIYPIATFPSLLDLPTPATAASYLNSAGAMMAGTGGGKAGTPAPTGDVATGWTLSPTTGGQTGLNVVGSKTINPDGFDEQTIRISGSTALTNTRGFQLASSGNLTAAAALPAGSRLRAFARLRIDEGNIGLFGAGIGIWYQGTNVTAAGGFALIRAEAFIGSYVADSADFEMDGSAVDYLLMTQDLILPPLWATGTGKQVYLRLGGIVQSHNREVDATVRVSQFGLLQVNE